MVETTPLTESAPPDVPSPSAEETTAPRFIVPISDSERVNVAVAEDFRPVTFDETLARARGVSVADACAWVEQSPALLFDEHRPADAREIAVVKSESDVPRDLWIVGDVHADVLTLANALALAESRAEREGVPPAYLFLGDFVDRGLHDHETLLFLFGLLVAHPDRVCVIPGNHDAALRFDEMAGEFRVTIEPSEYRDSLNAALVRGAPEDQARVALAKAFVRFCADRPKALFLPDGTLLAHGGFPHVDTHGDILSLADLCQPRCIDDFLWARIAETARVKRPNRGSRGHEFGWETFARFRALAESRLELPVRRLVRGHDHVLDRWQEYPDYADNGVPVLTLNAMGRRMEGELVRDGLPHPLPVVGRRVAGHLPEVVRLPLDPTEVDRAFPREQE